MMLSTWPFARLFIRPFVCVHDILKTNLPILLQVVTWSTDKGMKVETTDFGVQGSKVKVIEGWS